MFSLLPKFRRLIPIDQIIPQLIKHGGMMKIENLVQQAHLSNRQIERAFKDRMAWMEDK